MMSFRSSLALFLLAAAPALAAPATPSVDDIVSALKNPHALSAPSRGIRVIDPGAAPAAPPPTAETPEPQPPQSASAPSIDLSVEFASGSAALTPAATHVLDRLGRALTNPALANDRFRVEGHTDTVGAPAENQALSEQRAQRVAAYLEQKFGVSADRLQPVGRGEADLLVQTGPQVPEARNRRVHVVNLGS